ncbi:MAG: ATP-binding protein [Pseudomonadota bacterium]
MSLKRQLQLVSLVLLSLPWVGCQFLRETEATLRQGQYLAALATAKAIASALGENADLLYPIASRQELAASHPEWRIPQAETPLFADGFASDWETAAITNPLPDKDISSDSPSPAPDSRYESGQSFAAPASGESQLLAASWERKLFILAAISDSEPRYETPYRRGDRLQLHCVDLLGAHARYTVSAEAPGLVVAQSVANAGSADALDIRGAWRENSSGYLVELQMPLNERCVRLAIQAIDVRPEGERMLFDTHEEETGLAPWIVYRRPELEQWLDAFAEAGRTIRIEDRAKANIAQRSRPTESAAGDSEPVFWLLRWLYRTLLNDAPGEKTPSASRAIEQGSVVDKVGIDQATIARSATDPRTISASAPIWFRGAQLGEVNVIETTERYLALTDRATSRLLGVTALTLLCAFVALVGYASILSWRVRRLSIAATKIAGEELPASSFPRSKSQDELGELSRNYADLLSQISEYNRYLRGLASTLAHELRTPIAVIASSLDNLSQKEETLQGEAQQPKMLQAPATISSDISRQEYLLRARDGLARLTRIVSSMSEASRIEDSLVSLEKEIVDASALISALARAYQSSFPDHVITLDSSAAKARFIGNGDLIAQAIDKLVENAASFTQVGCEIELGLQQQGDHIVFSVSNPGPLLPNELRDRLFEPMVSLRETSVDGKKSQASHLGLGLFIARAIVRSHGGQLRASNRQNGSGVVVALELPSEGVEGEKLVTESKRR